MFDSNEGVLAGGPGTPQTQYGILNPKIDFGSEPLASMSPGSRYIRLSTGINNCGFQVTGGQMWFKCSAGMGGDCSSSEPQASAADWMRVACKMIFQGSDAPSGDQEPLCSESAVGDFYFIPDSTGAVSRLFIKWKDECKTDDWFELCPPKGQHPPAELTFDPSLPFSWNAGNQTGNVPPLKITRLMDLDGPLAIPPLTNTLNIPKAYHAGLGYLTLGALRLVPGGCLLQPLPVMDVTFFDTPAVDGYPMIAGPNQMRGVVDGPFIAQVAVHYVGVADATVGVQFHRNGSLIGEEFARIPACKEGVKVMIQHTVYSYALKGEVIDVYTYNDTVDGMLTETLTFGMYQVQGDIA